jgi:hypothetical protein
MGADRGVHEVSGVRRELPLRTTALRGNRMRVIRGNARLVLYIALCILPLRTILFILEG